MLEFQNFVGRYEGRHQELLQAAARVRRYRVAPGSRNGAGLLAIASTLDRISAAIRARYPSTQNRPAANAASAWRTS
jgi:hypothetical protein